MAFERECAFTEAREFFRELYDSFFCENGLRMNERLRRGCITGCAVLVCLVASTALFGQALPDGKGKAEFERICTACHTASMSTHTGKTADEWRGVVNDMVSRGAQGSPSDMDNVVSYLSTYFAPGKVAAPTPVPATISSAPATPAVVLSSAEIEGAKRVMAQNGCIACHRVGEEGSFVGPTLNGVGSRRKPDEIRASILQPGAKVQPNNRQVRIVMADGKTVSGRILNQDGYSVQLVDASGHLVSYSKEGVKEFAIVDANAMPAFEGRIAGQDLDVLVRYLRSLTEPGK
jgi:putative heme-binding domain-containing protein